MKVLVTGAAGLLGSAIVREFAANGHEVSAFVRDTLDITRHRDVMARVAACGPDVVINCAAYNDVDGAQEDVVHALDVNAFAVRSLARAAAEAGAIFVHYSSDFVFDGETDHPYTEADAPSPRSYYSISKLLGEWFALEMPRSYVLRVESLFGPTMPGATRKSSLERIAEAIAAGREAVVFTDRTVSPSFVVDIAHATRLLVESHQSSPGLGVPQVPSAQAVSSARRYIPGESDAGLRTDSGLRTPDSGRQAVPADLGPRTADLGPQADRGPRPPSPGFGEPRRSPAEAQSSPGLGVPQVPSAQAVSSARRYIPGESDAGLRTDSGLRTPDSGRQAVPADLGPRTADLGPQAVPFGLYHCVNAGTCTWEQLAIELARLLGVRPRLVPKTMDEVKMQAARPRYCALSPAKLAAAGIVMPTWQDALTRYLSVRTSGRPDVRRSDVR